MIELLVALLILLPVTAFMVATVVGGLFVYFLGIVMVDRHFERNR